MSSALSCLVSQVLWTSWLPRMPSCCFPLKHGTKSAISVNRECFVESLIGKHVLFIQFTFLYIFQVKFTCSTSQNKCYTAAALIIMKCWKAFRISGEATPCFSHAGLILASTRVRISNKNKEFEFWKWTEL